MGMAASQARLLSITARMHDVEFQAQNIMNQKVALATQKDALYENYISALDATKFQVEFYGDGGATKFVDATFASVCGYQEGRIGTYAMVDTSSGRIIVSPEMKEAYENCKNDKYAFAWSVLGFDQADSSFTQESDSTLLGIQSGGPQSADSLSFTDSKTGETYGVLLMTETERAVYEAHASELAPLLTKFEESLEKGDKKEIKAAYDNFRDKLYTPSYSAEIYDQMRIDKDDETGNTYNKKFSEKFDSNMFNYYVRMFEAIQQAGGCVTTDDFSENGDTGNEWFNNMIKTGRAILSEYVTEGVNKGQWKEISEATSLTIQEVDDDKDLKKIEAQYQYELDVIKRKDSKFDQSLNKLETERTALKTEMDSIKQVKDDNIERTFGIFS